MKIFYTFLVAAVSLAGCVSSSEHNGDTAAADSLYQRSTQANLLHGWWISDDFLTQVEKKRS
ncbi:MAG: hypothetical protein ACTHJT_11885, partial [Cytophaga sp.]|uniref:hypothetical protein n=1 Tax=Cytophaga sp. TaxID=29535 RepID=UPI003F7FAFEB